MPIVEITEPELREGSRTAQTAVGVISRLFPAGIRRVLLVVPPDVDSGTFNYTLCRLGRYANYPAYGLGILAAHLRDDGIEVDILNLNNAVLKECRASQGAAGFDFSATVAEVVNRRLKDFQPDLAGISCMFSLTHGSAVNTCTLLKSLAPRLPLELLNQVLQISPEWQNQFLRMGISAQDPTYGTVRGNDD